MESSPKNSSAIPRPRLSVRKGLVIGFLTIVLFVTGSLLTVSLVGTRQLAESLAEPLISASVREIEMKLGSVFDPIRHRIVADCVALMLGSVDADDSSALHRMFVPGLLPLPQVGSMMIGDPDGRQYIVMRYSEKVIQSSVLKSVTLDIPPARPGAVRLIGREFSPAEWGDRSDWTLWDEDAGKVILSWEVPMPGYDPRLRPWHQIALRDFIPRSVGEVAEARADMISWTPVYEFYTTKESGVSAAVAVTDAGGQIRVVAYDVLLSDIAVFTSKVKPTESGSVFVVSEAGLLLGVTGHESVEKTPSVTPILDTWKNEHGSGETRFRSEIDGAAAWVAFKQFKLGKGSNLWVGVVIPESDILPSARRQQLLVIVTGLLALAIAVLLAIELARRFSEPVQRLVEHSRRISAMNLEEPAPGRAYFEELEVLSSALREMRGSLRGHIAAREAAAVQIADREMQVRALAENSPDVIARLDANGRFLYVNPAVTSMTGLDASQFLGNKISDLPVLAGVEAAWLQSLGRVFSTGLPETLEFSLTTPQELRHFESRVIPETRDDEVPESVLFVTRDITERVRAQDVIRESEGRYRSLIESAIVGIIVIQDGKIRFLNSAAARMAGFGSPDEIGRDADLMSFVDLEFRASLKERMGRILGGGSIPLHPGWKLLTRNGGHRWVQSAATQIDWGGAPALIVFLQDITDLRDAESRQADLESQLRQAQKLEAVGLLAGGVAHDFNNLLQVIAGNAVLAGDPNCSSEDVRGNLAEITRTVEMAGQLTRQLLAFGRRQTLRKETIDCRQLLTEHIALMRRVIQENIEIAYTAGSGPAYIFVDRGQIEQVLVNLSLNARDAMPDGGVISVSVEPVDINGDSASEGGGIPQGSYVRIVMTDTGHGMDAAILQRVFEPFFSTKQREKGTGLGLAVAYGIVKQHDGFVNVRSFPGEGSEFTVFLPRQDRSAVPVESTLSKSVLHGPATVLIAEDDEPVRALAATLLSRAGFTVIQAADGDEAVNVFRKRKDEIDVLFFDVMMPGRSGFDAARMCQALKPGVATLFASGYAAESLNEHMPVPDGAAIMQKPYGPEDLWRNIAAAIKRAMV